MTKVSVDVQNDHLEQLTKGRGAVQSLAELIWNALDADATSVAVTFDRDLVDGIKGLEVADNGTGITPVDAVNGFGRLGGSWKRVNRTTRRDGRVLHGKEGKGRYNAFALGIDVIWTSRSEGFGKVQELTIAGSKEALRDFDVSEPQPVDGHGTGTTVRISGAPETINALLTDAAHTQLVEIFALYLRQYPQVSITIEGKKLDPSGLIALQRQYPLGMLTMKDGREVVDGVVAVVEWKSQTSRSLYLCDDHGIALHAEKVGVKAPGFEFTAYVRSAYVRELHESHELLTGELHEDVARILGAAREEIRGHFRRRSAERANEMVEQWKEQKIYPYSGEPQSPVERSEREVFNIVALQVNSYLPTFAGADVRSKSLSLRLLKQGIESNPAAMQLILSEVLGLPKQKQDEMAELLRKTSLSSIITASKIVADRLDFIRALECLLFDKESKQQLLERRGLHRILVDHTWLFGEEYNLSVDDQNLNEVLAKHVKLLGREVLNDESDVRREDGSDGIVDLMLSQSIKTSRGDEREHLIVELKRPKQKIDPEVMDQVTSYARAVAKDERFRDVKTRWTFWAVSNEISDDARFRLESSGLPPGTFLVHPPTGITVKAMTWGEIIQNAKGRLEFYREQLNYEAERESSLEALRKTHEKYFPPVFKDNGALKVAVAQ